MGLIEFTETMLLDLSVIPSALASTTDDVKSLAMFKGVYCYYSKDKDRYLPSVSVIKFDGKGGYTAAYNENDPDSNCQVVAGLRSVESGTYKMSDMRQRFYIGSHRAGYFPSPDGKYVDSFIMSGNFVSPVIYPGVYYKRMK